jgi:hypothetical protein
MKGEALLARLARVVSAFEADSSEIDVAEVAWLAAVLASTAVSGRQDLANVSARFETDVDLASTGASPASTVPSAQGGERPVPEKAPSVPLVLPMSGAASMVASGVAALKGSTPSPLEGAARMQRALRPLKRRIRLGRRRELDEIATAERIATTGEWLPVLRPDRERWFDAVLLVDDSPSVRLWHSRIAEFRRMLEQLGAFRDIRTWYMATGSEDCRLYPEGQPIGTGPSRSPEELIDPAGRRLFLVASDCSSAAWQAGAVGSIIDRWGRTGPVAILQVLPQRLWHHTRFTIRPGRIHATIPGSANSRLRAFDRYRNSWIASSNVTPVLEMAAEWLGAWARIVAASNSKGTDIGVASGAVWGDRPAHGPGDAGLGADDLVARFRSTASRHAYDLAVCLSVVPVSVPTIRLVQRVAVPESDASHIAEVMLSGLLARIDQGYDPGPENEAYEFTFGVREILIREIRRSEAQSVVASVSEFLSTKAGAPGRTFPLVAMHNGERTASVMDRVLGWVTPFDAAKMSGARRSLPDLDPAPSSTRSVPDPSASWAVFVVNSEHRYFPALPKASQSAADLQECLTRAEVWGIPQDRIVTVVNPNSARAVDFALEQGAARLGEDGILFVYFVGYAIQADRESLCLSLWGTDPQWIHGSLTTYERIMARARTLNSRVVVVLDCTYLLLQLDPNGFMVHRFSGSERPSGWRGSTNTLFSSVASWPGDDLADRGRTTLTSELVRILLAGIADAGDYLTPRDIASAISASLARRGLPPMIFLPGGAMADEPFVSNQS